MKIGYCRVSTAQQNEARQIEYCKERGCEKIYIDKISGKDFDRPQFMELMDFIRGGDELIILDLSRLGRNLKQTLEVIEILLNRGVTLDIGGLGIIKNNDAMGIMMLQIIGAVAEFQRKNIKEAQEQGIKEAKKRGVYQKPKITKSKTLNISFIKEELAKGKTISFISKEIKVSRPTIYKALKLYS